MRSLLAFLTLATAATADDLTLRNGATFTGVVREQGDKVTIEMDYGSMTFKKIDVRSVVKGRNPIGDFDNKIRAANSTQDLAAVAAWALGNGLHGRAEGVFRTIVALEPDHAEARRALGFENVGGRWLTGDDLQTARGLVKVDGRWIPKEEAARLLELQAAAQAEADRLEAARRSVGQRYEEAVAPQYSEPQPVELECRPQPYPACPPYVELPPGPPSCPPAAPPPPTLRPSVHPSPQQPRVFQTPPLRITPHSGTSSTPVVRPMRIESK